MLRSYLHKERHIYTHLQYAQELRTLSNVQLHASMLIAQELPT
jgi:hypothetical protein